MTIREMIQDAHRASGRSIADVARESDLQQPTLSRYLSGKRELTSERLGRLLKTLGFSVQHKARKRRKVVKSPCDSA